MASSNKTFVAQWDSRTVRIIECGGRRNIIALGRPSSVRVTNAVVNGDTVTVNFDDGYVHVYECDGCRLLRTFSGR